MLFNHLNLLFLLIYLASCGTVNHPQAGAYQVKSDCPGAQASGSIQLSDSSALILDVYDVEAAETYGFPSTTFVVAASKISSQSEGRSCSAMIFEDSANSLLFACKENGSVICTIHLEK